MSTDYRFTREVSRKELEKAIEELKLSMPSDVENGPTKFLVTDGNSYVWAYCREDGSNCIFSRYGDNYDAQQDILEPISEKLKTRLLSEHDLEYFTDEERDSSDGEDL